MPLYEFFCTECQKKIEELCSSTINSLSCPSCGKKAGRVFSSFRTGGSADGGGTSSSCGG